MLNRVRFYLFFVLLLYYTSFTTLHYFILVLLLHTFGDMESRMALDCEESSYSEASSYNQVSSYNEPSSYNQVSSYNEASGTLIPALPYTCLYRIMLFIPVGERMKYRTGNFRHEQ